MKEDQLQSIPLFADLSSKERRTIAQYLKTESYTRNEIIFSKGNASNALYIVEKGRISLSIDGKNTLANLGPGSLLGEADFFQGVERTLTAKAASDVTVQVLDDSAIDAIIENNSRLGLSLSQALGSPIVQMTEYLVEQLGNASFTKTLSAEERQLIARHLVAKEYPSGEAIFRNHTPASGMYLVESGLVRLMGDTDTDYSELGAGEIFGEMSIISGKAHADTAQAAQNTVIWQLSPEDFATITQSNPEIKATLSRSISARLSQSEQSRAIEVLRQIPLFQNLSDEALADCAGYLMLRHIPAHQNTFQIGDHGDAMFIVESGQIDLYDDSETLTTTAGEGSFFGEMALMTGKSRTETARAASDTNLWALYRADFDTLLVKHPQLSVALSQALRDQLSATNNQFIEKHLRKLAVMGGLSRRQLDEISARLRAQRFNTGDLIFQEGQPGNELFFIENGYVERFTSTPGGVIPLPVLSTGDFVGETALLSSRPHSTTVRAQTDVDVWSLAKADFDELVYKYPNLSQALNRAMSDRLVETMELIRTGGTAPQPAIGAPHTGASRPMPQRRSTATVPPIPVRPVAPPPLPFSASRPVTARQAPTQSRQSRAVKNTSTTGSRVSKAQKKQASKAARPKKKSAAKSQAKARQSSAARRSERRSQPGAADSVALGAKKVGKNVGRRVDGVSRWYANLSLGSRVGLGILILLIVWLACIVPSASVIHALAASLTGETTVLADGNGNPPANNITAGIEDDLIAALPFVETTTPTATTTPSPSPTTTASATVTQTPIPTFTPTATFTPTPEDTPTVTPTPLPTDTPTPTATNTPAYHPPTNTPVPTATATPDADFIVTKVRKLTACENGGNHHIYLHVVDINGRGLNDIPVRISWGTNENDGVTAITESKDKGDGYIEFAMFKGTYSVQILGAKSQVASGITPDYQVDETCEITGSTVGNSLYHASFEVVFQRMW